MKTVLVTGGAGFLGSFMCEELLNNSYKVIAVDNLFRGKLKNIKHLEDNSNFKFIKMDLSEVESIKGLNKVLNNEKVDILYNLAAVNGTQYFYDIPTFVLDQNIKILNNVMHSIENSSVGFVIYSSSSEAYGEPMEVPTPETHPILLNAFADRDSYASSKALGDYYTKLFAKKYRIKWQILRIFNLYGERMINTKYGQVIPEFVKRAMFEDKFTIIGDGSHTRSFCYITDATRMMRLLMESETEDIINLGNDQEISILELAKKVHKAIGREFAPEFLPERPNDHKRRRPDISKLKSIVGDLSFVSLEDGIKKLVDFYKKNEVG